MSIVVLMFSMMGQGLMGDCSGSEAVDRLRQSSWTGGVSSRGVNGGC